MVKNLIVIYSSRLFKKMGYSLVSNRKDPQLDLYKKLFGEDVFSRKNLYNIGAGSFSHPAWTNLDYSSDWYKKYDSNININFDLLSLQPFPIERNSAEIVYTCHTIEHITNSAAQNLFNESYKILKKDGILRVVTPNIDLYYQAFINNDRSFFYFIDTYSKPEQIKRINIIKPMRDATIGEIFLYEFASSVSHLHGDGAAKRIGDDELLKIFNDMKYEDALDYCINLCPLEIQQKYPGNHINWWNFNKIKRMLESAGFEEIYISGYCQSLSPVMRNPDYFDNPHRISLYAEAIR